MKTNRKGITAPQPVIIVLIILILALLSFFTATMILKSYEDQSIEDETYTSEEICENSESYIEHKPDPQKQMIKDAPTVLSVFGTLAFVWVIQLKAGG